MGWFVVTAAAYALWQTPNWDASASWVLPIGTALYWFQLPGMIVHGAHGGYGDWRDPAIVIPVTAATYALLTTLLYGAGRLARKLFRDAEAA